MLAPTDDDLELAIFRNLATRWQVRIYFRQALSQHFAVQIQQLQDTQKTSLARRLYRAQLAAIDQVQQLNKPL